MSRFGLDNALKIETTPAMCRLSPASAREARRNNITLFQSAWWGRSRIIGTSAAGLPPRGPSSFIAMWMRRAALLLLLASSSAFGQAAAAMDPQGVHLDA